MGPPPVTRCRATRRPRVGGGGASPGCSRPGRTGSGRRRCPARRRRGARRLDRGTGRRLAVDPHQPHACHPEPLPAGGAPHQHAGHALPPMHRSRERDGLPAPVRMGDDVGGEQLEQPVHVTHQGRLEEAPSELFAPLARGVEPRPASLDPPSGADRDLSAIALALADDRRDLVVAGIEDLPQQEDRGVRLSSSTRNPSERESAVSACCEASGSGSVRGGSGSHVPT